MSAVLSKARMVLISLGESLAGRPTFSSACTRRFQAGNTAGDHNRLGIAVLMSYLRYPGRVLGEHERPHEPILNLNAAQLQMPDPAQLPDMRQARNSLNRWLG